jgi:hypothetical protein
MKTFRGYLEERVLSIGLNPKHDALRQKHEDEIHSAVQRSYEKVEGGYGGHGSGTKAESDAIRADIRNKDHIIKAVRRGDKVHSAVIYKRAHGRKMIALGHAGSDQSKKDIFKTLGDDNTQKRSWAEVSKDAERAMRKVGFKQQPSSRAKELTGKDDVEIESPERYTRKIGGMKRSKTILGYPKKEK